MKRNIIYPAVLLMMAASVFTACSSDESVSYKNITNKAWSISVPASKSSTDTRALADATTTLTSTWSTTDQVAVISSDFATSYGTLSPEAVAATATLNGTLSNDVSTLTTASSLNLYYPSTAFVSGTGIVYNYTGQDGTLSKLASTYDNSTATVTVSEVDATNQKITTSAATFANQQAIAGFKFVQKTDGTTSISVKSLVVMAASKKLVSKATVKSTGTTYAYDDIVVTPSSTTTDRIYVAINNQSGAIDTYTFYVKDANDNWWTGSATANLVAGKYYPTTLKLTSYPVEGTINGHSWVILQVGGIKWATMDIGATTSSSFGDYYAWGATSTYISSGTSSTTGSQVGWSTNNPSGYYTGTDETLPATNDIAHVKWGNSWRMPTADEFRKLTNEDGDATDSYTHTFSIVSESIKCETAGKSTEKEILISLAGYYHDQSATGQGDSFYWSSSNYNTTKKYFFLSGINATVARVDTTTRSWGLSVRPVSN